LAEKIAELTEDELARICDERGNIVPGAIAADSTNPRAPDRLTMGGVPGRQDPLVMPKIGTAGLRPGLVDLTPTDTTRGTASWERP
jgi:hypothetical protein